MIRKIIHQRELKLKEIIVEGTSLFIKDIKHFIGIWLVIWVPTELLIAVLTSMTNADKQLYYQIYFSFSFFFGILATMSVPFLIEKNILNEPSNMWESLRTSVLKWVPGFLTGILTFLIFILGTIFMIIPAIFIWNVFKKKRWFIPLLLLLILLTFIAGVFMKEFLIVTLAIIFLIFLLSSMYFIIKVIFATNSVILRDKYYLSSLKYSWSLTENYWWKTAIFIFILLILTLPVSIFQVYFTSHYDVYLINSATLARACTVCFNLLRNFIGLYFLCLLALLFLNRDYLSEKIKNENFSEKPDTNNNELNSESINDLNTNKMKY